MIEFDQMLSTVFLEGEWLKIFQLEQTDSCVPSRRRDLCAKDLILEMEEAYYPCDLPFRCQSHTRRILNPPNLEIVSSLKSGKN